MLVCLGCHEEIKGKVFWQGYCRHCALAKARQQYLDEIRAHDDAKIFRLKLKTDSILKESRNIIDFYRKK